VKKVLTGWQPARGSFGPLAGFTETAGRTPDMVAPEAYDSIASRQDELVDSLGDLSQAEATLQPIPDPAPPATLTAAQLAQGPYLTPLKRVSTYESGEWEAFILEWAHGLDRYLQVQRLGGSGDQGLDIIGFTDLAGFQGVWDGYQCKHYSSPLSPGNAYIEMRKVFQGVDRGMWILPRRYEFAAPKGCSTGLAVLLGHPENLKRGFLEALTKNKGVKKGVSAAEIEQVREIAQGADFSIFGQVDMLELIQAHREGPYYLPRFGGALPPRPPIPAPPADPGASEAVYLAHLLEAYRERHGSGIVTIEDALGVPEAAPHLQRQREAFYSAEALREFAQGLVPLGTYEAFMDDLYDGVIETHERKHADGLERLSAVLDQSINVQVDSNALIHSSRTNDRKGVCHQLSNAKRLRWVRP